MYKEVHFLPCLRLIFSCLLVVSKRTRMSVKLNRSEICDIHKSRRSPVYKDVHWGTGSFQKASFFHFLSLSRSTTVPLSIYSSHTVVTCSVGRKCCSLFVHWTIIPFITTLIYSFLYQMLELLSIIILIFSLYLLYQKLYSLFHPSY